MEVAIVLYPTPAIGHLTSMVELGKFILTQQPSLSVHILVTEAPYNAGSTTPYINTVSATIPSIRFHHLSTIALNSTTTTHHENLTFELIRLSNPNVHQALLSISETYSVKAFILDFFCTAALSVASQLNIPSYYYYASGAGSLAIFLYLNTLDQNTTKSFKDLKIFLQVPGVPPFPASDMPKPMLDRADKAYQSFLECSRSFYNAAGIIVNTFDKLEEKAVKAIREGDCTPDHPTPPLYCIGPLIAANRGGDINKDSGTNQVHECLTWLDFQPKQSVVFLCFGSLGLFSKDQLREIAIGLERSGQRFLWVVRNPPAEDHTLAIKAQSDPDLTSLLPHGFLERTKERGLVVKSWAPQVLVLNHEAIGGFVTHCGWNSTLEAVCAGVPMVAWPLYAEQRLNRVMMVEEIKIALPIEESENGLVSGEEVEKRVRQLMESEEGKLARERIIDMKHAAEAALNDGGCSRVALSQFLQSWK